MHTLGIILLVLASAFTAMWASRRGAAAARLRWLSFALAAAALVLALWTVWRMVGDHQRAAGVAAAPPVPAGSAS
ncbi:MAG: hypothetical protein V4617_02850 [Gemmatimonadota bacterium]